MSALNESTVEDAALSWFSELGYAAAHGPLPSHHHTGSESNCFEESNATPARWAPVEQRDLAVGESSRVGVEKRLAILDAHLASHAFAAGAAHTMAMGDIPLGCSIDRGFKLPIARESHPYVERWYQALSARAGAKQVVGLALA